jgi:prepilin-type N-terminal cleavage/methylation domain-containing protein/prepilin-type processing-associated H-X9-DG protein
MIQRKAFTLVELLVVISIIALLLSILMPSLQKAKLGAQEIVCRSNLKQYSLAATMYLGDNAYVFPNAWDAIFKSRYEIGHPTSCRWHDESMNPSHRTDLQGALWKYIGGFGKVHYCPTFAGLAKFGKTHKDHIASIPIEPLFCYSMNAFLGGFESGVHSLVIKSSQVKNPAEVFLFAEENCWPYEIDPSRPFYKRYQDTLNDNALCGAPLLPSKAEAWTYSRSQPPPYLDAFGSYHKTTMRRRNEGKANAVFVDGHAQLVEPDRTYYYIRPMDKQPALR